MPLAPGTRFGHYEILAPIGKGGMGEVYRARDTRLKRDVALKVLPESFARDPDRMARFQREAEVLASLNHPNTATIYGVEESDNARALAMELVEGATLVETIRRGPCAFNDALRIAGQICDALEYAHDKGIMHRDLKPANVMLTPDGVVKLLDFGLAKAFSRPSRDSHGAGTIGENSPTLTMGATEVGVILGTAGYMSPEQARGKQVDKRADIWSFGVVLYELLTGERLFKGGDQAETLAAVIHKEPDLTKVPQQARRLLEECLQKDPKQRLRDIGDAKRLLSRDSDALPSRDSHGAGPSRHRSWLPWCIAAFLLLALMPVNILHFREKPPAAPEPVVFQIAPPEKNVINGLSVSPDGRHVAFTARGSDGRTLLWVRSFAIQEARGLGVEAAAGSLFWSPDSRLIGFATGGFAAKLKKIEVTGGPPQTICDVPLALRGAAWSPAGVVVFGSVRSGLMQVSASGGTPSPLTLIDRPGFEDFHGNPAFLPDGRRFLYQRASATPERNGIYIGSLDAKPEDQSSRRLIAAESAAVFVLSSSQVLFEREGALMAQPFDSARLELAGDAVRVADNVPGGVPPRYAVSAAGVLAYQTGTGSALKSRLVWYDRQGKLLGEFGPPSIAGMLQLSGDGKRVAVSQGDPQANGASHVWIADTSRGVFSRLNPGETYENSPAIAADGRVAFSSTMNGAVGDIYASTVNGLGAPELWAKSSLVMHPNGFSADGRFLIYDVHDPQRRQDLWILPTLGDRKPIPFLTTPADETFGQFSPDGKWIAYSSDESGRREVYVQGFAPDHVPASAVGKWLISAAGGDKPRWRRDGKELFYLALDGKMMAVPVKSGATFEPGAPVPLFETHSAGFFPYDVSPDGRFLINTPLESDVSSTPITVVLNWQAGLKK